MMNTRKGLSLGNRFMVFVALGLMLITGLAVAAIAQFERAQTQRTLHQLSVNEMTSLHALIVNVMARRPEDGDNIGIRVFNNWFDSRNQDYPGMVWSAWGDKVTAFMAQTEPERAAKAPRDDIDREAIATRQPVGRLVDGAYRYSLPIVLGVTEGANQEVCRSCHGAGMGLVDGEVIAVLSSSLSTAEADSQLRQIVLGLVVGGVALTLIAALAFQFLSRRIISRPLSVMTERMAELAGGNCHIEVPALERRDEIGAIAQAVQVFKENTRAKQAMEAAAAREAEARTRRIAALEARIQGFDASVGAMLGAVGAAAARMMTAAETMLSEADSSLSLADGAAHKARAASLNVQTVAAAVEQMRASAGEIGRQAHLSSESSNTARQESREADARIGELADAAAHVNEVVGHITTIAEKTNMLALNATIEAARAGEAGKGFAVVAHEVKELARLTVQSTEGVSSHLVAIQQRTNAAVEAIRSIRGTIRTVDGAAGSIAEAIAQQGAATGEIAEGMGSVAAESAGAADEIAEVAASIARTDDAAREVVSGLGLLNSETARLRHVVDDFLINIRQSHDAVDGQAA
jgi:methyl-accepting chemotaxis protein